MCGYFLLFGIFYNSTFHFLKFHEKCVIAMLLEKTTSQFLTLIHLCGCVFLCVCVYYRGPHTHTLTDCDGEDWGLVQAMLGFPFRVMERSCHLNKGLHRVVSVAAMDTPTSMCSCKSTLTNTTTNTHRVGWKHPRSRGPAGAGILRHFPFFFGSRSALIIRVNINLSGQNSWHLHAESGGG